MPFLGFRTWYRIAEPAGIPAVKTPLVLLHGGPGSTASYMELFDELCEDGRAVISYDQLGCGNSFLEDHPELWRAETWLEELCALKEHLGLERMHLLGQSWGGMLLLLYLIERKGKGAASAVLSSTLPSSALWGREQHRMIRFMSEEDRAAIREAEGSGDYSGAAYLLANEHFMERHCAGPFAEESPECLRRPRKSGRESYVTAWGPNEFTPLGTLRDFDCTDRLCEIRVPALIVSGTDDLCTPLIAKTMADRIQGSRWELFEGCRHMCFADDHPRYMAMMREWLLSND